MNNPLELLHVLSTLALFGLIWTIQCVHYPTFKYVAPEKFSDFHAFHTQKITLIVAPLMIIEIITATLLCFEAPSNFIFINFTSVMLIWILTAFVSVPLHGKLSKGFQLELINKLIITNWPRTVLWTLRTIAWAYILLLKKN